MKVLLIDNKSAHLERLKQLIIEKLGAVEFMLRGPREMEASDVQVADLIVFSGGAGRSIAKNPHTFHRMVMLAADAQKPTVGICLGAEAIAATFGAELQEMPVRRAGNVRLLAEPSLAQELSFEVGSFMAYEFHKWKIVDLPDPLVSLATSKDGIEIFRHTTLPLWGLQFHPEVRRLDNPGHAVFEHILDTFALPRD